MKTTLKQLAELFKQYASSDENPQSIRQFAAQLAILTAHVGRIEAENKRVQAAFDSQIAELAQYILKLRQQPVETSAQPTQPAVPQQAPQAQADDGEVDVEEGDVDDMVKKIQSENAAEAASIIAKHQKPNGQAEASS